MWNLYDIFPNPMTIAFQRAPLSLTGGISSLPENNLKSISESVVTLRGGGSENVVHQAASGLLSYLRRGKLDVLLLLLVASMNAPVCKWVRISPILGFLAIGLLLGPNGQGLIKDIHTTEMLADIGIVFFLFEMGMHLNAQKLKEMRLTVFGLGGGQFCVTALAIYLIATIGFGVSAKAAIVIGGGLALSSSAFVLQLLKDKDELSSTYGRSSFGVLLLQDLMVVPLMVITPLLAGKGNAGTALALAGTQLLTALVIVIVVGLYILPPAFEKVIASDSQEALISLVLLSVLGMSFLTEGLGLSNTLGAFLVGVVISESPHRIPIEEAANPIRGILVGLFFCTVGFEINLGLALSRPVMVAGLVVGLVMVKTIIAGFLSSMFGCDATTSTRVGLVLSQAGEFAFVVFRVARDLGILSHDEAKVLLTVVSLSMAVTPILEGIGARMQRNKKQN